MTQRHAPWAPLLPAAMIGTDRHGAGLPVWPGAIGQAIAALPGARRAAGVPADIDPAAADLLRAAGILAACERAGARPIALAARPAAPAGTDDQTVADDPAVARWFDWTLREGPERLKQAFFLRFARAGLRLPHALLPTVLELARQSLALRAAVQPLLGARGIWLARQREAWQFAAGVVAADDDDPRQWTDGTLAQRKAFLTGERARDPRAARDRLAAAMPELPAKERAELAHGLAVGLGPDDEPLLDQLRADRSQDVRAVALELLLRLPGAAHPARAAERVAALMSRGSLLTGRRWAIEAPAEAAADWKADQIEPVAGPGKLGQRAWWLYQLVRQVPLAWWTAHTGLDVRQLAAWADGGEWAEALWMGWRDVLRRAPDRQWAEALLEDWPAAETAGASATAPARAVLGGRELVLWIVSPEVRERHFERQLDAGDAALVAQIHAIVAGCAPGAAVSPRLAARLVPLVRRALGAPVLPDDGPHGAATQLREAVARSLPELCCTLPLSALADFNDWPVNPQESAAVGRARHEGRQIIQARRALDAYLP